MTFALERVVRSARKPHRCVYCRHRLEVGKPYVRVTGVWDGEFFSEPGHIDCRSMWTEAFEYWGDPIDGMSHDLFEACGEDWSEIEPWRGFYPHVVCRMDFFRQIAGTDDE